MSTPVNLNDSPFKACQQWNLLRNELIAAGADVIVMDESPYPLSCFVSNGGLQYQDRFILSQMTKPRDVEMPHFGKWFNKKQFNVRGLQMAGAFEGAGDAIFSHDRKHLWLGVGLRTHFNAKIELDLEFDDTDFIVRPIIIKDKRFAHLHDIFNPLDDGTLLWYPDAFDDHGKMVIESWYPNRIEVTEQDALMFAVNAVSIDDTIIVPYVSRSLSTSLKSRGYKIVEVDMSEFIPHEGACKSLTLEVVK